MKITTTKGAGSQRLKVVVLGRSGAGKTYLASTLKPQDKTLFISGEAGQLTLTNFSIPMLDITVDDKGNTLSNKMRYEKLIETYNYLNTDEARKKFSNIYIDGITEIGGIVLRMLEEDSRFSSYKMLLPRFAEYTSIMTKIILMFRDLPHYNVFFTGLVEQKEEKDEKGKVIKRHPASVLMPGSKIPENVPAYFDEVLYLGAKMESDGSKKRFILTQETKEAFAKDRSGNLDKFEKPDLSLIINKIKGEK